MSAKILLAEMDRLTLANVCKNALDEVIELAKVTRMIKFIGPPCIRLWENGSTIKDNVVESLVDLIYEVPELIHPCVDIGVAEVPEDYRPIVFILKSGHSYRPYMEQSWSGRSGPLNYFVVGVFGKEGTLSRSFSFSIVMED